MSAAITESNRSRTPSQVNDEIGKVQIKLQTLAEVLKLYGDKAEDISTEGFCDLISVGIDEARGILCDISEALQASELSRSTEQGALKVVKRELAGTPTD